MTSTNNTSLRRGPRSCSLILVRPKNRPSRRPDRRILLLVQQYTSNTSSTSRHLLKKLNCTPRLLNAKVHDVIPADRAVVDDDIPGPQPHRVPLLYFEAFIRLCRRGRRGARGAGTRALLIDFHRIFTCVWFRQRNLLEEDTEEMDERRLLGKWPKGRAEGPPLFLSLTETSDGCARRDCRRRHNKFLVERGCRS